MILGMRSKPISRPLHFGVAAASAFLQLHLFFVLELHSHNGEEELSGGQTKTSVQSAQGQNSSTPDPICAACRISHQGAIQLAAAAPLKFDDYRAGSVPSRHALKFDPQFLSHPSSRAPPLS